MAATTPRSMTTRYRSIDEYHASFPAATQGILDAIRKTIKSVVPEAEEVISYNMPAFKQGTVLVYYAAYEHHIGFYPTTHPIEHFKEELKNYKTSKGAIQFPIDKPLPLTLIKKIVKFRSNEVATKSAQVKTKKANAKAPIAPARKRTASK